MAEASSGIRSKPQYSKLQHDPLTRWSFLIGEGDGLIALINLFNDSPALKPAATSLLYCGSDVEKAYVQAYFTSDRCSKVGRYEDRDALLKELPEALEQCFMGTRLYIAGSEAFMWKVQKIARSFGMHNTELSMELRGSRARRVYCPHCETVTEGVSTDVFECSGCSLNLINVDHFSREMGAYLGFRVDAENPGEVPDRQELHK